MIQVKTRFLGVKEILEILGILTIHCKCLGEGGSGHIVLDVDYGLLYLNTNVANYYNFSTLNFIAMYLCNCKIFSNYNVIVYFWVSVNKLILCEMNEKINKRNSLENK